MNLFYENYYRYRYREALTDLLKELERDPDTLEVFTESYPELWEDLAERGLFCLELEQFLQAEKVFEFLLKYRGEEGEYLCALGESLAGQKRYMEAAEKFLEARESDPETAPIATFFIAEIWLFFRHFREGIEELKRFLECSDEREELSWAREQALKYLHYAGELAETTFAAA